MRSTALSRRMRRCLLPLLGAGVLMQAAALPVLAQPVEPEAGAVVSPELSPKERAMLERIRALKAPRWRTFGVCRYDWSSWRLAADGVRTTAVQCGKAEATETVAVHCDTLKLSYRLADQPWSTWRLPYTQQESTSRGGEDLMVASLCANVQPTAPRPQPAQATPQAATPSPASGSSTPVSR